MSDRNLDKELKEILLLKEKLPKPLQQAIKIANSIPDTTSNSESIVFINNRGGTDANSQ